MRSGADWHDHMNGRPPVKWSLNRVVSQLWHEHMNGRPPVKWSLNRVVSQLWHERMNGRLPVKWSLNRVVSQHSDLLWVPPRFCQALLKPKLLHHGNTLLHHGNKILYCGDTTLYHSNKISLPTSLWSLTVSSSEASRLLMSLMSCCSRISVSKICSSRLTPICPPSPPRLWPPPPDPGGNRSRREPPLALRVESVKIISYIIVNNLQQLRIKTAWQIIVSSKNIY